MLSRVADSLYWIGRYAERIETNAHIVSTQLERMLEHSFNDEIIEKEWQAIIKITGYIDDYQLRNLDYHLETTILYSLFDRTNLNSIESLAESVRLNLKNARDIVPAALWETCHDMNLIVQRYSRDHALSNIETNSFLNEIKLNCLTATGIIDSLMTRDESFLFMKIGKWIERSEKTALTIRTLLEREQELSSTFAVNYGLLLTNAQEDYSRRHRMRQSADGLQFLIADFKCTRSVAYGIKKIHQTLLDLQDGNYETFTNEMFSAIIEIETLLQIDSSTFTADERLDWIRKIHENCLRFGPIFTKTYFLTAPILV